MISKERLHWQTVSAALVVLGVAVLAIGQSRRANREVQTDSVPGFKSNARQQPSPSPAARREDNKRPPDATKYSYDFAQPKFYNPHILIQHDAAGVGKITFERLGEATPIVEPVELSTAALGRIMRLWSELGFLNSREDYQAEKQFPHLGTMQLHMENGEHQRTAEFNWTNNKQAAALVNEYRRVADQAIWLFDFEVARANQPLNTPKLMEVFENYLTRNGISDPYQLVPLLRDITTDEHLPLITRNHAERILKTIEK